MISDIRKMKSRGFGLVELLIVIAILGILAGMTLLAYGRSSDNAEAASIMAGLDSSKNALLAYSMEYRTRNNDPLVGFIGAPNATIIGSIDKYLDANVKSGGSSAAEYFKTLSVISNDSTMEVGFVNPPKITSGIKNALDRKVSAAGWTYRIDKGSIYAVWLRVR